VKILLAPLHGITNYVFRNTLASHVAGIDAAIAPFLPVMPVEQIKTKSWKDILPENNTQWETMPQLMGNVVSHCVDTAQALADLGYPSVNWNLGCPMNQIVRRQRGCGLMPYPELIEDVLKTMGRKNRPLSLKIRMGLHHRKEGRAIIEMSNDYPLDFIIIHPRLGEWQYKGTPDLEEFAYLLSHSQHRIIYNGDINTVEDFNSLQRHFPNTHDWMIGRGLLRNPFLAEEIKGGIANPDLRKARFHAYYSGLITAIRENKGERSLLPALKEMWHYFSAFWCFSDKELYDLLRINDLCLFQDYVNKHTEIH
jgi:tRNA-dihydrouridine synthase